MSFFKKIKDFAVTLTGNAADITLSFPTVVYVGETFPVKVKVLVSDVDYAVESICVYANGDEKITLPGKGVSVDYDSSYYNANTTINTLIQAHRVSAN